MKKTTGYILILILLLAGVLRIVGLNKVPPELFGDEVDVGYQAYSILTTGKDYSGNFLPFYIESFSEWRAPLLMYVNAPFVGIFGLNEWGVRLPSALLGIATVYLIYWLGKKIFNSEVVGLVGAFAIAISPWHLQYSRAAFEASLLLFLLLLATVFAIKGLEGKTKRTLYWLISVILFSLTFYTYNTANIFVPLLALGFAWVWKKEILGLGRTKQVAILLTTIVFILPIVWNILFGFAALRFSHFSVFSDKDIVDQINQRRTEAGGGLVETLAHNKLVGWSRRMVDNYASAFSTEFLFKDGDYVLRHSIGEIGEFFWIESVFLILGVIYLVVNKTKYSWLVFWWLIIAPIPAALTKDGAHHATRLILMLPPLIWLISYGFVQGYNLLSKKSTFVKNAALCVITIILTAEFGLYLHRYWIHYPKETWRWWHVGYKDAMQALSSSSDDYNRVFINDTYEPAFIRFVFWTKQDPRGIIANFKGQDYKKNIIDGFDGFSYKDKYFFGTTSYKSNGEKMPVQDFIESGDLYLVSQRDEVAGDWDWSKDPPSNIRVLKTIYDPYEKPIFYLITKNEG